MCPVNVIETLCALDPAQFKYVDKFGLTLLHHMCSAPLSSVNVVEVLLRAAPRCCARVDNKGRPPLFCAMDKRAPAAVVQQLSTTYPTAVRHRANDHQTIFQTFLESQRLLLSSTVRFERNNDDNDNTSNARDTLYALLCVFACSTTTSVIYAKRQLLCPWDKRSLHKALTHSFDTLC